MDSGAVYFKITNIEYDVLDIDVSERQTASDAYFAATMGELGCWVDPKITQMVQAGLEHSRVPDVTRYLGIGALIFPSPETYRC